MRKYNKPEIIVTAFDSTDNIATITQSGIHKVEDLNAVSKKKVNGVSFGALK